MLSQSRQSPLLAAIGLYVGGITIGLTLVSFPASSVVLKQMHGFTDAQYGAIYLPQLIAAIAGALAGGAFVGRLGLRALWLISLVCFAAAQLSLAASSLLPSGWALIAVMCGTGFFGFGFGFGGGPLNAFAVLLFPRHQTTALTALHMSAGAGLTMAPFYFNMFAAAGFWLAGPVSLLIVTTAVLVISLLAEFPTPPVELGTKTAAHPAASLFFWLTALVSVIYSIAEGTFSNWALLFVEEERHLSAETAALSLTCFWGSITLGRLLVSVLVLRVPPTAILATLPVLIAIAFWLLPGVDSPGSALLGFAFAGFACSAFFPMLVTFSAKPFAHAISWIASMLTAAMMVGVGIGSYLVGALHSVLSIGALYHWAILNSVLVLLLLGLSARLAPIRR